MLRNFLKIIIRLTVFSVWFITPLFQVNAAGYNGDKLVKTLTQKWGPSTAPRFSDWQKAVDEAKTAASVEQKLQRINDFWNKRIQFMDDQEAWGLPDYWATPMDSLGHEKGDCEDYAIAKYYTLLSAGLDVSQLRLIYVKAKIGGPSSSIVQAHMVLGYFKTPDAEPLILDNLLTEIHPASRRSDLVPVFSFNSQGVSAGTSGTASAGTGRLSRWEDLLTRAKAEGFE